MQSDLLRLYDGTEPRSTPKQASKFECLPIPVVPEVSLILDNPRGPIYSEMSSETTLNSGPSEIYSSYAAWKQKQFSYASQKSNGHIFSSTQNNANGYSILPKKMQDSPVSANSDVRNKLQDSQNLVNSPVHVKSLKKSSPSHRLNSNYAQQEINNQKSLSEHLRNEQIIHRNHTHQHNEKDRFIDKQHSKVQQESPKSKMYHDQNHICPKACCNNNGDIQKMSHKTVSPSDLGTHYFCKNPPDMNKYEYDENVHNAIVPHIHQHYSPERLKHHLPCCSSSYGSGSSSESINNLIHIVNSQNEQIKSLQKQIERLLKLHEQSLKEKSNCRCFSGNSCQNGRLAVQQQQSNLLATNYSSETLPQAINKENKINQTCNPQNVQLEDESKQAVLEQKVSIGVMTSFELKVHNNQSLVIDTDERMRRNHMSDGLCYMENMQDLESRSKESSQFVEEISQKRLNRFNPTTLENISEGSESHVSSKIVSSNFCTNSSKQSLEPQETAEFDKQRDNIARMHNSTNINYQQASNNVNNIVSNWNDKGNQTHQVTRDSGFDTMNNTKETTQDSKTNSNKNKLRVQSENQNHKFNNRYMRNAALSQEKLNRCENFVDDTLSLTSSDIAIENQTNRSPDPSIHVEMQEYDSEEESGEAKQTPKLGWTFYNNVLDQVNQILQNSPIAVQNEKKVSSGLKTNEQNFENKVLMNTIKLATIEQLTKLGISFVEKGEQIKDNCNKNDTVDSMLYPRLESKAHLANTSTSDICTSMHMKNLAMKYLTDEQLAELAAQKSVPPKQMMLCNVQNTNLSFATMGYLQRYHLLPDSNSPEKVISPRDQYPQIQEIQPAIKPIEKLPNPVNYPVFSQTSKATCPSKILDISTLKQQPKLL